MRFAYLTNTRTFEAEGGGSAPAATVAATVAPAAPAVPASAAPASSQDVFPAAYVRELRDETKGYRLKAEAAEKAASEAKAAVEAAKAEGKTAAEKAAADLAAALKKSEDDVKAKFTEATERANAKLVRAEVKVGAAAAGLAHPDFIKLLDTSKFTVDEDGEVVVPKDFWTDLKAAQPHLFAATGADKGTTSNPAATPKPAAQTGKHARDMTDAEADAALKALVSARY